jgi:hypothetical protein
MMNLNITDEYRIVVPVRFRRFNHGEPPAADCPEIDSRGYVMARTSAWGTSNIRGPLFGVSKGDTVKVRVDREDIDSGCPLFATSSNTSILEIANDAGRIESEGELHVEGKARGTATIQIRLGSTDGPVLAEADVRVHAVLRVNIKPWFVRIDTPTAVGTAPVLDSNAVINRMRAIWRPAGIHFRKLPASHKSTILPTNTLNQVNIIGANWASEIAAVFRVKHSDGDPVRAIDWFIVREFTPRESRQTTGWGGDRRTVDSTIDSATGSSIPDTGIISSVIAFGDAIPLGRIANTTAHEVGHFFRLSHVHRRNAGDPAPDTYSRLQLMFPLGNLLDGTGGLSLPRFDNVGYGEGLRGALLTMKNHDHHSSDGEVATARNAIQSNNWY